MNKQWTGTTYGNGLMHRWLIALLRHIDVRIVYVFAYLFVVPPCLLRSGFKPIYHYFRLRFGYSAVKSFAYTYLNHCMFAQAVIDKFSMYADKRFQITIDGYHHFSQLAHQPQGFVQLSSHLGNYEIAGYSLSTPEKPFNALLYQGEKSTVMANRSNMFLDKNIRMLPASADMSHLFQLHAALQRGEIVSIAADRIWGSSKSVAVPFLGGEARFPLGPFHVATLHQQQVLVVHVMKETSLRYKIYVKPLPYDKHVPRQQQIQQLVTGYVQELECMVRRYPTQWYNYYEFWER